MRALLLSAGIGSRLRPLTDVLPKCLVPIHGRPLLENWLYLLGAAGVQDVLVNIHHHAHVVREFLETGSWQPKVSIVSEPVLLGTGGTAVRNRDFFKNEAFLLAHADNLTLFDVQAFFTAHAARPAGCEITMMTFGTPTPQSCGIVELDTQGVVKKFHEKVANPPGNLANAAVYIFEPGVLNFMTALNKDFIDLSTEVLPEYLGRIYTYRNFEYHRDIGTMQSWLEAQKDFPVENDRFFKAPNHGLSDPWQNLLAKEGQRLGRALKDFIPLSANS